MASEQPISDVLRQAILQAIDAGETTFLGLERDTGVLRQSLMKFARNETSLRGDLMDKVAKYFGMELVRRKQRLNKG